MTALRLDRWRPASILGSLGLAAGGAVLGLAAGAVGARFGPLPLVALPVAALAAVAIFATPVVAPMVLVASLLVGDLPVGGQLQLVDVAAISAIAGVAVSRLNRGLPPLPRSPAIGWLVALVGFTLVASLSAIDPDAAARQEVQLLIGLLLVVAVAGACTTLRDVRVVTGGFLLVGAIACATSFRSASELQVRAGGAAVDNRAVGIFTQPNQLGAFASLVLLVAVGAAIGARSRRAFAGAVGAGVCALGALALSLSRGSWIGTAVGVAGLVYLLPETRKRLAALAVVVLVLIGGFAASRPESTEVRAVRDRLGTVVRGGSGHYEERPAIWREAFRQISSDPMTGVGPGGFPAASGRRVSEIETRVYHAHNVVLTVAAEAGLPAAALLLAATFSIARRTTRAIRRLRAPTDRAQVAGVAAALVAFAGQGLFDFTMRNAVVASSVWLLLGLLVASTSAVAAFRR